MKKTLFILRWITLCVCILFFYSCGDSDPHANGNEKIEIIPDFGSIDIFNDGVNFVSTAGEHTISFTTNKAWVVSVANTTGGEKWCTISPSSGEAGNAICKVNVTENLAYDDRSIVLTLQAGDVKKTIIVTQKQKNAILLTSNRFEVDKTGGIINVEVKANVDYMIEIPVAFKDWIKRNELNTRALTTKKLSFNIASSEEYDKREGEIVFKNSEVTETIKIYQTGKPILLLSKNEYSVGDEGDTIAVEIKSNFEYAVDMPNVDWVKEAPKAKSMSSHTLYYLIGENETYEERVAEIIYYDKNNTSVADTLKITQRNRMLPVTLNVRDAGTLPSLINDTDKYRIRKLILSGTLNGTDIRYLREMMGCDAAGDPTEGKLSELDLSKVTIVQGGDFYYAGYTIVGIFQVCGTQNNNISDKMFCKCSSLVSIILPESIDYIGFQVFSGSKMLRSISINAHMRLYPFGGTFLDCPSLKEIKILPDDPNYSVIDGVLFNKDQTELVFFPNAKSSTYKVPNGVEKIGVYAFGSIDHNLNLKSIEISEGVTRISKYAFNKCSNLENLILPSSLEYIEESAFFECSGFKEIHSKKGPMPPGADDAFRWSNISSCALYVPKGAAFNYKTLWRCNNVIEE